MLTALNTGRQWLANPYDFLDKALARYGLTFYLSLPGLGRALISGEPELIGQMMRSRDLTGGKGINVLRALFGDGSLIMLHGESHRARRRLISPHFRPPRIAGHDDFTVATTRQVVATLPIEQPFAIYDVVRLISLRAIIRAIFGSKTPADAETVERLIETFLASFQSPAILFLKPLHLDLGPRSPWGRAVRNRRALQGFIRQEIERCRCEVGQADSILAHLVAHSGRGNVEGGMQFWGEDANLAGHGDARPTESLHDLWERHPHAAHCPQQGISPTLDDEAIVAEIMALLLFGHDTGAATMAWAFGHIYQNPAVVERIRAEVEGLPVVDPIAYPYLQACLNESMRLCPVVAHLIRVAERATVIGGYRLEAGQTVIPCTYLAQHNPAIFPEPQRFRPERFLDQPPGPTAFFPFGFSYRTCVGKRFVWRQMVLILATIIPSVDLALAPGYRPRPTRQMVLIGPREGTQMVRTG